MKRGNNSPVTTDFNFKLWYGDFDYYILLTKQPKVLTLEEILSEIWRIPEEQFQREFTFKTCIFKIYEPSTHHWELIGSPEHRIQCFDSLRIILK